MAVIIPVGFGQATFVWTVAGKADEMNFTCGYTLSSDFTEDPAAAAIRGYFVAASRPFIAANISTGFKFEGVRVTANRGTGPILGQDMTATTGTAAQLALPTNCCVLLRKTTARGGRKGRGRMFLPAGVIGEAQVNQVGEIDASSLTAMQTQYTAAVNAWIAGPYKPVLLHEDGSAPDNILAMTLQRVIATQRRRMRS